MLITGEAFPNRARIAASVPLKVLLGREYHDTLNRTKSPTGSGEVSVEERHTPRVDIHCPVVYLGDHVIGKGTITNLSAAGCGLQGTTLLKKDTSLSVSVSLPGEKEPLMVALAAVRWALGGRAGLEFLRLGPEGCAQLRRYLSECQTEG